MTLSEVGEHGRERLEDAGLGAHRGVDAGQDEGDERAARVDTARRLVRRLDEADLCLGGETGEDVFDLGERRPQVLELAHRAAQHFDEGVGPLDGRGLGAQRGGEHAAQHERGDILFVSQRAGPRLEESAEGHTAVPEAAADDRLNGCLQGVAHVSAWVQGIHRGFQGGHRRCAIGPGVAVSAVPSVQVVKERREPGGLLSPGAARLDNDRCIQFHDSPFSPLPLSLRASVCAT